MRSTRTWQGRVVCLLAVAASVAVVAGAATAQVTVSTLGSGAGPIAPWGTTASGATPTYGQQFVVPAGNGTLDSITFKISNATAAPIPFQAYIYQWTGTGIVGPPVFATAPMSAPPSGASFASVTVTGANAHLTPGQRYAVVYSTIGFTNSAALSGSWQTAPQTSYPSGAFVFNNGTTFSSLFTPSWAAFTNNLAFELQFTPTTPALTPTGDLTLSTLGAPTSPIAPFGAPDSGATPTYGQKFVAPAGFPLLESVTFEAQNPGADAIPFQAYLYRWNGTQITGNPLYMSDPQSIAPTGGAFDPITVSGLNALLTPGDQYALVYSTIGFTGPAATASFRLASQASDPLGSFIFNNQGSFDGIFGPTWTAFGSNLAYEFHFARVAAPPATVPEPSSAAVLGLAPLAFLAWRARRRRQIR